MHTAGRASPSCRQRHRHDQFPGGQHDHQPPWDNGAHRKRDHRGHDVEPVGGRVEYLAQPGLLVQRPGDLAVEPVGEPGRDQHADRPPVPGRCPQPKYEPQEHRHAGQPGHADRVRNGQDLVARARGRVVLVRH
jgi:hypothetical protein